MNDTALTAANCRWAKTDRGSIGDAARRSQARKTASPITPSDAMVRTTGDDQPSAGASMNAKVMPDRNTTMAAAPR
jgi:hypothetical protein